MEYLIKFDKNGRRCETYVAEEKKTEEIKALLNDNFELVPEEDYQLLIGNIDGKEHYKDTETGLYKPVPEYVPTLDELKAEKLRDVDSWTAAQITGGFVSECSGERVRYDSDKDTQLTMQGIALNVDTAIFTEKYPNGCPVRGVKEGDTAKTVQYLRDVQVMQWCADLSIHIGDCKQAGWAKQAEVKAATSKEELDAIILE